MVQYSGNRAQRCTYPASREVLLRVIDLRATHGIPIREFSAVGAAASHLGSGDGAAHAYVLRFAPGGSLGAHEAGSDQILVPLDGSGWAAGADGERRAITVGEAALIHRGEVHAKGSDGGMIALMVQIERFTANESDANAGPSSVV